MHISIVPLFLLTHYQLTRGLCLFLFVYVFFWCVGGGVGGGGLVSFCLTTSILLVVLFVLLH